MQNILNTSPLSLGSLNTRRPPASMLEQYLPDTADQILQACFGPAELVAYGVRQALNEGLTPQVTAQLLSELESKPLSEQSYTRHVLHADPEGRFTVAALVWGPTHSSPVHAHHTWCAYRVLKGELSESHYAWDSGTEKAFLCNKVKRTAGQSVCGNAGLELIHRLANESQQPAISLHVYGVDAGSISTHVNLVVPWAEKM